MNGSNHMRKKIIHILVYTSIILLMLYFIVLPVIKWNISYDLSSITSGEKAVEYYLNAIDEKNPKKASMIYPSLNEGDSSLGIFDFTFIEYCKIDNIEEYDNYDSNGTLLTPGEKIYYAEFSWRFAFSESPDVFMGLTDGDGTGLYFQVAENEQTGNWYIVDAYTGV